jgi:alkylation response protein AidB-like acyl-CoA dehydrogenase
MLWAQGYSEPQAGTDLASLGLKAEIVPDGFILNGQKIWTSKAHEADWLFVLARTDPKPRKKQDGISFLLIKLDAPGIDVRPIRTMDGFTHFCETFFENVKVPKENLVGELHKGWEVAKALLGHERFTHPTANPHLHLNAIENIKSDARRIEEGDGVVWDNPVIRRKIAALEMDVDCLKYTRYRALTKVEKGEAPGPETQIFKLFGAELMQRIVEAHQEVAGPLGIPWDDTDLGNGPGEVARHGTNIRAATIRGGTSEVQRNVVSKRVLGLPESKSRAGA